MAGRRETWSMSGKEPVLYSLLETSACQEGLRWQTLQTSTVMWRLLQVCVLFLVVEQLYQCCGHLFVCIHCLIIRHHGPFVIVIKHTFVTDVAGEYSCLRVNLVFARELSFYVVTIYVPCFMIVVVSWFSFWLDYKAVLYIYFLLMHLKSRNGYRISRKF